MYNLDKSIGAPAAWTQGVTGKGVTVAVIDTGIAPVPGLDGSDKVIDGPDLSFESQVAGTRYRDGFGHGTHMAGIIAGQDASFDPKKPTATAYAGVAPEARLLNMKVGAADGGVDVSQVIAALDWVVAHRNDNGMNVRVVNLSYGTESTQSWQVDPLARAVENAWKNGIVVVAAAGNNGPSASQMLMPAVDPTILSVGAVDHMGTASTADDKVADFSNGGSLTRRPDVVAPGKSVVSLRVPGSYVDVLHPEGLVPDDAQQRYFRGSGTSQAAAVVSGEAALLLQANPKLTPDQVKALLVRTARPLAGVGAAQGAGATQVDKAVAKVVSKASVLALPTITGSSTGRGSLEASRGGEHVLDPQNGALLKGEVDALGTPWNSAAWTAAEAGGKSWVKGDWNGRTWTGSTWANRQFQPAAWTGNSWSGIAWSAHTWSDASWQARSWRGVDWKARSWREESWSARSWRELS
jgi:serine protease AprX